MPSFPENDIIGLIGPAPRHDLAESVGPDLALGTLFDPSDLGDLPLSYGTAAGSAKLRAAIAETHGVQPDDVVVTVGGAHALFLLAFILCGPGAEAVIAQPCFPFARDTLSAVGAELKILQLPFDSGYQLDPLALAQVLSPRTKLVSVATPQNPSGVATSAATILTTLDEMQRICPDAYLLIDETYREAAYGADAIAPCAAALSSRVISVASLSKCHGAPGLRIGWAIVRDPTLRRRMIVGKFSTVISCSTVDEALALRVFERRDVILSDRRRHLQDGLRRTENWVHAHLGFVDWVRPDAGALCCVRLRPDIFEDADVTRFYQLLAERDARVSNGAWFGDEPRVFRLGFGLLPMPELDDGLAALGGALRAAAKGKAPE